MDTHIHHEAIGMPGVRATICVDVHKPDEGRAVAAWFAKWRDQLTYCSNDEGCGCCVHLWNVEGPPEALAELPAEVHTAGAWTNS